MRYNPPMSRRAGSASAWSRLLTCSLKPMFRTATPSRNAPSPRPPTAAAVCPIPTARPPTGNTRNRAPELFTCWADRRIGGYADSHVRRAAARHPPIRQSARPASEALRLIDQHDRNVVFDGVDQPAGVAHQELGRSGAVLKRALALRAHEDPEQVGREAHTAYPRRLSDGAWRRHLGRTLTWSSR